MLTSASAPLASVCRQTGIDGVADRVADSETKTALETETDAVSVSPSVSATTSDSVSVCPQTTDR